MMRNFIFQLGYYYFLLIIKTSTARLIGEEELQAQWKQKKNVVFCCPHNFLLGLFAALEAAKMPRPIVTVVASLSSDGELIAKLLKKFHYELARGSSNRGGKKALLELARSGKEGKSLGLAFDGPKGPPLIPKRGLMGCVRVTNGPVFLVYGHARACKFLPFLKPIRLNSWDKFLLPVPFCHIDVYFEKIPLLENSAREEKAQEDFILDYIEKRSKEIYSSLYL